MAGSPTRKVEHFGNERQRNGHVKMLDFSLSAIVLCALLSVAVSCTRSPFMALMYSVLLFLNASFVLLMLGFEFLALVNLLVYVGALAVLFLFVIMLLEIPATELRAYQRGWSTLCFAAALAVVAAPHGEPRLCLREDCHRLARDEEPSFVGDEEQSQVYSFGLRSLPVGCPATFVANMESISSLGHALYLRYADLLILNSLVLTVALFGALVLAHMRSA